MNRRTFFKSLLALPVVAAIPSLWTKAKDTVAWYGIMGHGVVNDDWYCILHPTQEAQFKNIVTKNEWRDRYRAYRVSLKTGGKVRTPHEIMEGWEPFAPILTGEVGRYEGVRWITL